MTIKERAQMREDVYEDYQNGMTPTGIKNKYGISHSTFHRWKRQYWSDRPLRKVKTPTNRVSFEQMSKERLREIGRMGGEAAAKAHREKKAAREVAQRVLAGDVSAIAPKEAYEMLEALGLEVDEMNVQAAILASQAKLAFEGNQKAAELIFAMAGERPVDKKQAMVVTQIINPLEGWTDEDLRKLADQ